MDCSSRKLFSEQKGKELRPRNKNRARQHKEFPLTRPFFAAFCHRRSFLMRKLRFYKQLACYRCNTDVISSRMRSASLLAAPAHLWIRAHNRTGGIHNRAKTLFVERACKPLRTAALRAISRNQEKRVRQFYTKLCKLLRISRADNRADCAVPIFSDRISAPALTCRPSLHKRSCRRFSDPVVLRSIYLRFLPEQRYRDHVLCTH